MRSSALLLVSCLLFVTFSHAQNVGVGTATPAAKLDITSSNSGVLIPRIALSGSNDVSTVPSPVNATLIFNTATVTGTYAITPGYYWWNSSRSTWTKILDNASTPGDTNIYNTDGTLTGSRTMTMGADNLTFTSTTGNLVFNPSSTGRIGIGTASPNATLAVVGKGIFGDNTVTNNDANDNLYLERVGSYTQMHVYNNDGSNPDINAYVSENTTGTGSGFGNNNPGFNIWTASAHPIRIATNATERVTILSGGNVGINNISPASTLDVGGVINTSTGYKVANAAATSGSYLRGNGTNFVGSAIQAADVPTLNQNTTGSAGSFTGSLAGDVTGTQGATALSKIQGTTLTVSSLASGNLLQYNGTAWVNVTPASIAATNIYNTDGTLTASRTMTMGADNLTLSSTTGNLIFNPSSTGRIGIGTASPNALFSNNSVNTVDEFGTGLSNGSFNWNMNAGGYAGAFYNAGGNGLEVKIAGTSNTLFDLTSNAAQGTAGTSDMIVLGNGYVGLANDAPATRLDVNGTVRVEGAIATHSQGVQIEWNKDGGSGMSYLLNQKGLGAGGMVLGEVDANNNITQRIAISGAGAVTIPALSTAGVVTTTAAGLLGSTATVPVANGGTGSTTQNWVDLTTAQTAAGVKTWSSNANFEGTLTMNGTTQNTNQGIEWYYATNDRYGLVQSSGGGTTLYTSTNFSSSFISFDLSGTAGSGLGTELMRITHGGQVGIGLTAPNASLDVNGNIQIDNSTIPMGLMTELPGSSTPLIDLDINFRETNKNTSYLGAAFRIDARSPGGAALFNWFSRAAGSTTETDMMVLTQGGYLGLGTTSPLAPFHVSAGGPSVTGNGNYFSYAGGNSVKSGATWGDEIAYFQGGDVMCTGGFVSCSAPTFSDRRIKNVIKVSDGTEDLALLNQIQITKYKYIDTIGVDAKVHTKVIAQQVEQVFPEAVDQKTNYLPEIYAVADHFSYDAPTRKLTVTVGKAHDLKAGDLVEWINGSNAYQNSTVSEVKDEHTFVMITDKAPEKVFVYGKQVHDFRVVDYQALSTLNISATQELARKVAALEARNAALEDENCALRGTKADASQVTANATEIESLKEQVSELKAWILKNASVSVK